MKHILAAILLILSTCTVQAQPDIDLLESGSEGMDFWIAIPPNEMVEYPKTALQIYVASRYDTEVSVYDMRTKRTVQKTVRAGGILTLTDDDGSTNWAWELRNAEAVENGGVRITADHPIVVYVLNSKGYSTDGYLARPVHTWGIDHIVTAFYDFREIQPWAGGFVIVASQDGTDVEIDLRGTGGELGGRTSTGRATNRGQTLGVAMKKGQTYMVHGNAVTKGAFDLTGTRIRSNKPVGLINFHMRTAIPSELVNGNGRNHLVEWGVPVSSWGRRYVSVPFARTSAPKGGRGDYFRVVASQDHTTTIVRWYDVITKVPVGADTLRLLKAGDFVDIRKTDKPVQLIDGISVWEADAPIQVLQYSCSASFDGDPTLDPFMIALVPEEQFVSSALFQTPMLSDFTNHFLTFVVRVKGDSAGHLANLRSILINGMPLWNHADLFPQQMASTAVPGTDLYCFRLKVKPGPYTVNGNDSVDIGGYVYGYGELNAYGWPIGGAEHRTDLDDTVSPSIEAVETGAGWDVSVLDVGAGLAYVGRSVSDVTTMTSIIGDHGLYGMMEQRMRATFSVRWRDPEAPDSTSLEARDWAGNRRMVKLVPRTLSPLGSKVVDFGKVYPLMRPTARIELHNPTDNPMTISDVHFVRGGMFRTTLTKMTLSGNQDAHFDVMCDSSYRQDGVSTDTLLVRIRGVVFPILVTADFVSPVPMYSGTTSGIYFVNERKCERVQIANTGTGDLVIVSLEGLAEPFGLQLAQTDVLPYEIRPGEARTIEYCVMSTMEGRFRDTIRCAVNLDKPVLIPVEAAVFGTVSVPDDGAMSREGSHIVGNVIPSSILPVDMEVATLMDVTGRIVKEWRHEARKATGSDWPETLYVGDVAPSYYVLRIRTGRDLTMMSIIVGR